MEILIVSGIVITIIGVVIFLAIQEDKKEITRARERNRRWAEMEEAEAEAEAEEAAKNALKQQLFKNELFEYFDLKDNQKEIIWDKLNNFNAETINDITSHFNEYIVLYPETTQPERMRKLILEINKIEQNNNNKGTRPMFY